MAKMITQGMFDDVVRENMDEFELEAEEAVKDAIEQFEAQGVSLGMIVKDPSLYDKSSSGEHLVITSIKKLRASLDKPDLKELVSDMKVVQEQCDLDLSHRVLAAANGAFPVLLELCQKAGGDEAGLCMGLETLCSLCNGQPDLLNEPAMIFFCKLLDVYQESPGTLTLVVRLIRLTCIMHETNRQAYVELSLITHLSKILDAHVGCAGLMKESCAVLRVLTSDDDIRVPFGKGHEHAKIIVTEENTLKKIMNICKAYAEDSSVLSELFLTLSRLAVRNEFCQEIMDLGGLDLMLRILITNCSSNDKGITKHVLGLIKTIAGNDDVKRAVAKAQGLELILAAMTRHARHAGIAQMGCDALATVCLRHPDHCRMVMELNGAEVIVKAMQIHHDQESMLSAGCLAIRNIVARTREFCPLFLSEGAEAVLRNAMNYKKCADTAKAALRDLDQDVHLKELWKGEGVSMQRD